MTPDSADTLYRTGADILASARARGLPLEAGNLGDGWELHNPDAPDGGQYASRLDDKAQVRAATCLVCGLQFAPPHDGLCS
mgnify:CR=1 FL=1